MDPHPVEDEGDPDRQTDGEPVDELDAREAARMRRRDHDAEAHARDLMRPGMGKVFKQITDSWGEKATGGAHPARKGKVRPG